MYLGTNGKTAKICLKESKRSMADVGLNVTEV